jgi:hypothetical protein
MNREETIREYGTDNPVFARMARLEREAQTAHVVPGERPTETARRWGAQLAAAKGRKPEPQAKPEAPGSEPEPPEHAEPGELLAKSKRWAAELAAARYAKAFTITGGAPGAHKLEPYRA